MIQTEQQSSALVAIVGRPNVGKSSILNRCIGQKISITSRKPQTTRFQLQGIYTKGPTQLVFVDTPGWQKRPEKRLNRMMNKEIDHALNEVDIIVMVAEARHWLAEDDAVAEMLAGVNRPKVLVLNKHDRLKNKDELLPLIEMITKKYLFDEVIPTNALQGDNIDTLISILTELAPHGPHLHPDDALTDKSARFLVAEILREKLMRSLGDELPYAVSVMIDKYEETTNIDYIDATIWIERQGQKGIVIGKQGAKLKAIASSARQDMENLLDKKVHLRTWVKLRPNWSDDIVALNELDFKT